MLYSRRYKIFFSHYTILKLSSCSWIRVAATFLFLACEKKSERKSWSENTRAENDGDATTFHTLFSLRRDGNFEETISSRHVLLSFSPPLSFHLSLFLFLSISLSLPFFCAGGARTIGRCTWINKSAPRTRGERYCKIRASVSVGASCRDSRARMYTSENKREAKNIVWEIRRSAINKSRRASARGRACSLDLAIKSCALFPLEEIYNVIAFYAWPNVTREKERKRAGWVLLNPWPRRRRIFRVARICPPIPYLSAPPAHLPTVT